MDNVMSHLIDKDALVAEIEKRKGICDKHYGDYWNGCYNTFTDILSFIDTIEVKEVDLCKEEERIWKDFNMGERHLSKNDLEKISKYFFELGLKAQKGEDV